MSSNCARAAEAQTLAGRLEALFDDCFAASEHTLLRGGAPEPLYTPGHAGAPAIVRFRHDYAASALHEVAHWCIAGAARRRHVDYGYWYAPDGRDQRQQEAFLRVEARPQALEWVFSRACGLRFRPSIDNLDAPPQPQVEARFAARVAAAAESLRRHGLPPRAARFHGALCACFAPAPARLAGPFDAAALRR